MKKAVLILGIIMSCGESSYAQQGLAGIGVGVGSFQAVTMMFWIEGRNVEYSAGLETVGEDAFQLQYSHRRVFLESREAQSTVYAGLGARLKFEEDERFGIVAPVGANVFSRNGACELFIELLPTVDVLPRLTGRVGVFVGLRGSL